MGTGAANSATLLLVKPRKFERPILHCIDEKIWAVEQMFHRSTESVCSNIVLYISASETHSLLIIAKPMKWKLCWQRLRTTTDDPACASRTSSEILRIYSFVKKRHDQKKMKVVWQSINSLFSRRVVQHERVELCQCPAPMSTASETMSSEKCENEKRKPSTMYQNRESRVSVPFFHSVARLFATAAGWTELAVK